MAPHIETDSSKMHNVFQPGLIRGAARLPFAPHKRYFYVEHPTEGWRVYLRSVCFIHELGAPFQVSRFIVVKRAGGDANKATWEPTKGQMEGKDGLRHPNKNILNIMKENVRREVHEESKISFVHKLQYTGFAIESRESDYPPNHFFQYHIFQGYAHPNQVAAAAAEFAWFHEHPAAFAAQRSDKREKDDLGWYSPHMKMMGKWSPTIVKLYLAKGVAA